MCGFGVVVCGMSEQFNSFNPQMWHRKYLPVHLQKALAEW